MADVIVSEPDTPDEHDRELGRTEGIAEVHAEEAGENAAAAELAAQAAINAAEMNAAVADDVASAEIVAGAAADEAGAARDAVLVALNGQTAAIESLVAELRTARETPPAAAPPKEKATPAPSDKPPARKPRFRDRYNKR